MTTKDTAEKVYASFHETTMTGAGAKQIRVCRAAFMAGAMHALDTAFAAIEAYAGTRSRKQATRDALEPLRQELTEVVTAWAREGDDWMSGPVTPDYQHLVAAALGAAAAEGDLKAGDDFSVRPADAIRWVLWERLRHPGHMPKFPFTLTDLEEIDPASVKAIDRVFLPDDGFNRRYPEERGSH